MIKIIKTINKYEFPGKCGNSYLIGQAVTFEFFHWPNEQLIAFIDNNSKEIHVDLIGRNQDTKVLLLNWQNFTNNDINLLTDIFNLTYVEVIKDGSGSSFSARLRSSEYEYPLEMAIKKGTGEMEYYFVIFFLNYPDRSNEAQLYVHGIWEISADEHLLNIIGSIC